MNEPYRPAFPKDDDYIRARPGARLITNLDYETEPFPNRPTSNSWRAFLNYEKRLAKWLSTEGNKLRKLMGDPVEYDAKNLSAADITEINHLLFDPDWKPLITETIKLHNRWKPISC